MSACWVFSHWEYLTIWKESSWRLLWEDTWLYLLLVLLWECHCRRLQLGFIIYGGFQGNSFLGAGCGQLLEVLLSLQSTWEVELSVLSIVKVILMYKRSFMSVDFRKRSCPLFSVWEDFMLKFSLDEKDKDYFKAGVIKEKDQTLFLFKLVYRCFTILC